MSGYVVTPGSFPKGMVPGLRKWIENTYADWEEEFSKIFDKISSSRQYEEYAGVIGMGLAAAKPDGQNITYDSMKQGFVTRLYNVTYALGFQITKETIKDGNWMPEGRKSGKALSRSFRVTKETVGGLVLSRAFTSTYAGADGLELCSTVHVNKSDGTTYSNELDPALDLSELALEQLAIQIEQTEDERGLPIKIRPELLIVAPADVFNAERILKSTLNEGTANNAINALKSRGVFSKGYAVNHFFNAGNGAFFIKTDAPDGMIYQERQGIEWDTDNEFENKNAKFSGDERYAFGWDTPRGFFGCTGAA